jgi:hypothetical protein
MSADADAACPRRRWYKFTPPFAEKSRHFCRNASILLHKSHRFAAALQHGF